MKLFISALVLLGSVQALAGGPTMVLCEARSAGQYTFEVEGDKLISSRYSAGNWNESVLQITAVRETSDIENDNARRYSAFSHKDGKSRKVVSGRAFTLDRSRVANFAVFDMADGSQMALTLANVETAIFDSKACKR